MKDLRRYIRNILLESSEELRKELVQKLLDYNEYTEKEMQRTGDYDGYRSVQYRQDKKHKDIRREAKIFWNANADHEFFKTGIRKYHKLGYVGKFNPDHYFSKNASKNELSCFGGEKTQNALADIIAFFGITPDIKFYDYMRGAYLEIEGTTTWAGGYDAYTEELSQATAADKKRMKSSGLAKRPGTLRMDDMSRAVSRMMLDEEDFIRNDKHIDEMVVDNWKVKTFWVSLPSEWKQIYDFAVVVGGNRLSASYLRRSVLDDEEIQRYHSLIKNMLKPIVQDTNPKLSGLVKMAMYCAENDIPVRAIINGKGYDGVVVFKSYVDMVEAFKDPPRKKPKEETPEEILADILPYTS